MRGELYHFDDLRTIFSCPFSSFCHDTSLSTTSAPITFLWYLANEDTTHWTSAREICLLCLRAADGSGDRSDSARCPGSEMTVDPFEPIPREPDDEVVEAWRYPAP